MQFAATTITSTGIRASVGPFRVEGAGSLVARIAARLGAHARHPARRRRHRRRQGRLSPLDQSRRPIWRDAAFPRQRRSRPNATGPDRNGRGRGASMSGRLRSISHGAARTTPRARSRGSRRWHWAARVPTGAPARTRIGISACTTAAPSIPVDVRALGFDGEVFAPGEWGRFVNGGAWLRVDDQLGRSRVSRSRPSRGMGSRRRSGTFHGVSGSRVRRGDPRRTSRRRSSRCRRVLVGSLPEAAVSRGAASRPRRRGGGG